MPIFPPSEKQAMAGPACLPSKSEPQGGRAQSQWKGESKWPTQGSSCGFGEELPWNRQKVDCYTLSSSLPKRCILKICHVLEFSFLSLLLEI